MTSQDQRGRSRPECFAVKQATYPNESDKRDTLRASNGPEALDTVNQGRLVDEVVDCIAEIHRRATIHLALDVGAVVVERLLNGNLDTLRARGRKDHSLRRLAEHPRLPFSSTTLWRCIGAYEVVRSCPEVVQLENLSIAHIVAVRSLPRQRQLELLAAASDGRRPAAWIKHQTRRSISSPGDAAPARHADLPTQLHRIAAAARDCVVQGDWNVISESRASAVLNDVAFLQAWVEGLSRWIEARDDARRCR